VDFIIAVGCLPTNPERWICQSNDFSRGKTRSLRAFLPAPPNEVSA